MINIINGFMGIAMKDLKMNYFSGVIHSITENPNYYNTVYVVECFSNGVLTYPKMINKLSKTCNDTKENIHKTIKKHISSFGSYKPKFR